MNQQRGRRFRSAKDAEDARKKAAQKGEELPDEPFDSNCITPGTVFMAELSKQLRYFINKKVSEDKDWQGVEIVLSGHEVLLDCVGLTVGSWRRRTQNYGVSSTCQGILCPGRS
jgi:5'-3' exonuclease